MCQQALYLYLHFSCLLQLGYTATPSQICQSITLLSFVSCQLLTLKFLQWLLHVLGIMGIFSRFSNYAKNICHYVKNHDFYVLSDRLPCGFIITFEHSVGVIAIVNALFAHLSLCVFHLVELFSIGDLTFWCTLFFFQCMRFQAGISNEFYLL